MIPKWPNILLIVVDCLRSDHTFGPQRSAHIPTLQSLAEKGTIFSHMITVNSVTVPCMTSMLSGMYPINHGVREHRSRHRIPDRFPLLAEILHDNGYNTYAEVTTPLGPHLRLNRGFDSFQVRRGPESLFIDKWGEHFIARFKNREFKEPWFVYLHVWEVHQPRWVLPQFDHRRYGDTCYDRAITSVDARLGELFGVLDDDTLILVTGDHGEKIPENKFEAQLERAKAPMVIRPSSSRLKKMVPVAHLRKAWYSSVRFLHKLGLSKKPLAGLTGHGFHVYDSLVRVPLVIGGCYTFPAGQVIRDQIRQIDVFPTILEMIGLGDAIPDTIDGRSVVPLLQGEKLPPLPVFIETWANRLEGSLLYGVRTDNWKYAYSLHNSKMPEELYDLRTDPGERRNLATSLPNKVAEMRSLADQHFEADQEAGVLMTEMEYNHLTEHLRELGYID